MTFTVLRITKDGGRDVLGHTLTITEALAIIKADSTHEDRARHLARYEIRLHGLSSRVPSGVKPRIVV